jgi:hypothetical protein
MCVCSVYYQPNSSRRGGPLSRPPAGCALGSVGNPFDRVWPPTTSGDLQPIFSGVSAFLVLSAAFLRSNGVIHRTQKVIQGDDNGHVGRPGVDSRGTTPYVCVYFGVFGTLVVAYPR